MIKRQDFLLSKLSYKINGVLFEVFKELGAGHRESFFQRATATGLTAAGIKFREQVHVPITFKGQKVGKYFLDFMIEDTVVLELKQGLFIPGNVIRQTKQYLEALNLKLGLVACFTHSGVIKKRVLNEYWHRFRNFRTFRKFVCLSQLIMYNQIASNKRRSVLLAMIFIALIIGLGYVYSMAMGDTTYGGVWIAIIISLGSTAISYYSGDKIALFTSGAKPATKEDNAYVYRLVENLCITAGIKTIPKIYTINDPAINAFATGRDPSHASVAVTTGAIEKLTNEELEGVLAHELSHVTNYDIRFMMLVAVMVGSVSILAHIFLRANFFGGRRNNDKGGNQLAAIFMIIGIVLAILSPIIAELIKLAISRRREYLADASGSLLTRYPEGLASALEKIAAQNLPLQSASPATAHMFLSNPFKAKSFSGLFSTHPPIQDRINKLRNLGV